MGAIAGPASGPVAGAAAAVLLEGAGAGPAGAADRRGVVRVARCDAEVALAPGAEHAVLAPAPAVHPLVLPRSATAARAERGVPIELADHLAEFLQGAIPPHPDPGAYPPSTWGLAPGALDGLPGVIPGWPAGRWRAARERPGRLPRAAWTWPRRTWECAPGTPRGPGPVTQG